MMILHSVRFRSLCCPSLCNFFILILLTGLPLCCMKCSYPCFLQVCHFTLWNVHINTAYRYATSPHKMFILILFTAMHYNSGYFSLFTGHHFFVPVLLNRLLIIPPPLCSSREYTVTNSSSFLFHESRKKDEFLILTIKEKKILLFICSNLFSLISIIILNR